MFSESTYRRTAYAYTGHPSGRFRVSTNNSEGHRVGVRTPAIAWNAIASSGDVSGSK